jgi:hypothetical protein
MTLRRLPNLLLPALWLALLLPGCASYRLGTGAALPFSRVYVAPVGNTAGLAQAEAVVTARIREALLREGRVSLAASPDQADALVTVDLVASSREILTVRPDDTGLARKFGIRIDAVVTLTSGGKELVTRRPVSANRQIFTDSGQIQAEYDVLPLLAADLGEQVARAVLDVW